MFFQIGQRLPVTPAIALIVAVAFGTCLSADEAQERRLWHLELRNIGAGADYKYPYSPICFSPDSKLLAISLANHPGVWERRATDSPVCQDVPIGSGIGIWKTDTLEFVKWIKTDARKVIRFSPDGREIAALDESRLLRWAVATGEESATTLIEKPTAFERLRHGFTWLSDDRIVAIKTGGLAVYSEEGKQLDVFETDKTLATVTLESSQNGQQVIADSCYWDLKSSARATAMGNTIIHASFRPGTNEVWGRSSHGNGAITVWNPVTGSRTFPIKEGLERNLNAKNGSAQYRVEGLAFNPNGKVLASVGNDSCIHLWNATSGQRLTTLEATKAARKGSDDYGVGMPVLKMVQFSPDGKWLLACSDESVSMFRVDDLKPHIKQNEIHRVTQYFAGSELVEEVVTNPPGVKTTVGTFLHTEEQLPGTRVAALRKGNDEVWYDAVILAKTPSIGKGIHYNVHFEGYSRNDNQPVAEWRLRPKLFPELKMKDVPGDK